jgi:hypothetical protein
MRFWCRRHPLRLACRVWGGVETPPFCLCPPEGSRYFIEELDGEGAAMLAGLKPAATGAEHDLGGGQAESLSHEGAAKRKAKIEKGK